MYVLYYGDSQDLVGVLDSKRKAITMARVASRERDRAVVCIFNAPDGTTSVCFKFERGEQTFDGGCCPPAWGPDQSTPEVHQSDEATT